MYRWLLCFRYLRTRYIALASVVSVMLGVATLIVVNSVMAGFSAEMHQRLHGLASDIVIECYASSGLPDPEMYCREIETVLGDRLLGTSVSVHVPAMLGIEFNDELITRHVNLVGIDPQTYDQVSQFGRYLLHPENQRAIEFTLRDGDYARIDKHIPDAGWGYRREQLAQQRAAAVQQAATLRSGTPEAAADGDAATEASAATGGESTADGDHGDVDVAAQGPSLTFGGAGAMFAADPATTIRAFDPAVDQYPGIVLGIATCSVRQRDSSGKLGDHFYARPGDDVRMMFPNAADNAKVVNQRFTVVDLYESGMSEYDSTFAFVRLDQLQEFRGMIDPQSGLRSVTTIQLRLVDGADLNDARDALQRRFPSDIYPLNIQTWRDMQGPLLASVQLQTTILNVLLFLIIAVAGFGILATFFMIVMEKTRDIGTLKALGASGRGVMSIFLAYGLLLGVVGSGIGLLGGMLFVDHINEIAGWIERLTGQEVFDPSVYYFSTIPTIIEPWTVVGVMLGAILIAVLASVLPALRAARMNPVEALRFE